MYLDFFVQKGHREVHSSSLVPANDPTLLFSNAGMNQFKDLFLGLEKRDYIRATTSQKCVRAGGKHNDLENVGFTNRHHTFFEMLGNFSFGDYFKQQAIAFAWELVTSPEWLAIDKEKLYVTIFGGEKGVARDDEAYGFWIAQGVKPERIFELGMKENFWQMGETGPCGPCSEIHYDMGVASSDKKDPLCAAGKCKFPCECGRYVEIWNLVFMQFDRSAEGVLTPLPKPSIDTGMGLERVAAIKQGVVSNYETDLFVPLIEAAAQLTGVKADLNNASLRVIADHSRAATFLISDGILPANEGRGYVLRKILRRAIRHGRLLGQSQPFLSKMVDAVVKEMGKAYPEIADASARVAKVIETEEKQFDRVLKTGMERLDDDLAPLVSAKKADPASTQIYDGAKAFKLYDTFGLPLDFMVDAARDQGIGFDQAGFDAAMSEQRSTAKASWKGGHQLTASPVYRDLAKTAFDGYTTLTTSGCKVLAIIVEGKSVQSLEPGQSGEIVLDRTPFYAEMGGQAGDKGQLVSADGTQVLAEVSSCRLPVQGVYAHIATAKLAIKVGDKLTASVDKSLRDATRRHHTATHILHAALRQVLGDHVKQAGSLVEPGHLRFDFSHFTAVASEELAEIERLANEEVLRNEKVETFVDVPIDEAVSKYHAMALFGEKYGDTVRVVKAGGFSTELCGGTHVSATGDIGLIKILKESSVSSGVRRIEAICGEAALEHFRQSYELENVVGSLLGRTELSPAESLKAEMARREEEVKKLRKELEQLRMKSAASAVASAGENVVEVKGIKVLAHRADNLDRPQLRTLVDNFRNKIGSGVVVIGSVADGKLALIAGVTKDLTAKVQAGKVVGAVAKLVGGSGGGRPDLAEAGGKEPEKLDAALKAAAGIVEGLLG
jgi:alanyl-tRNA synthetase